MNNEKAEAEDQHSIVATFNTAEMEEPGTRELSFPYQTWSVGARRIDPTNVNLAVRAASKGTVGCPPSEPFELAE